MQCKECRQIMSTVQTISPSDAIQVIRQRKCPNGHSTYTVESIKDYSEAELLNTTLNRLNRLEAAYASLYKRVYKKDSKLLG